jgi:hypothetical protein
MKGKMAVTFNEMSDSIDALPVDKNPVSLDESKIIDTLFQNHSNINKIFEGTKDIILAGLLYLLFAFPQMDEWVKKMIPSAGTSEYILVGVKTVLFMFLYFVVKNMYLVRK